MKDELPLKPPEQKHLPSSPSSTRPLQSSSMPLQASAPGEIEHAPQVPESPVQVSIPKGTAQEFVHPS